jgi:hypothetical protein
MPENCRYCELELEFGYVKVMSGSSEVTFFLGGGGWLNFICHEIVIRAHRYGEISVPMQASVPGCSVSHFSILVWAMKCLDALLLSQEGSLSG